MFPYNESEWDFISSAKTLQGEIKWLRSLKIFPKKIRRKTSLYMSFIMG